MAGVYCVLRAYIDESYDSTTMCIGGWLCAEEAWTRIEMKWLQRIEVERGISEKHSHIPISRYHATDCANLKNEFSGSNGWDIPRQIKLTKKLIDILGTARPKPTGVASGVRLKELQAAKPNLKEKAIKRLAYYLCMCDCLQTIGQAMDDKFPSERVVVIYEGSEWFNQYAGKAYDHMKKSKFSYADYFKTFGPGSWKDFPALQPADLIAYEGFKLTTQPRRSEQDLRKSLQRVIGHDIDIYAGFLNAKGPEKPYH